MAAEILISEPIEHQCGNSLAWNKSLSAFPASEGWVLSYAIRGLPPNAMAFDISGSMVVADGDDFQITVSSSVTSQWTPGTYWLVGYATLSGERYEVYRGQLSLTQDIAAANETGYDGRTYYQRILDQVRTVIENGVIREVIRYSYNGVTSEIVTMEDAFKAEAYLVSKVAQEAAAGKPRRIKVRFINPQ